MVRDFRNMDLRLCTRHGRSRIKDHPHLFLPQCPVRFVIAGEIHFQCNQHPEDLFLVHLHSATDSIAVRWSILSRSSDQIFSSQQESRTLWTTNSLAT